MLKGTRSASKEGDRVGEAVLVRNDSANVSVASSRPSTTSFSTFDKSLSSYEDDGQISASSDSTQGLSGAGVTNKPHYDANGITARNRYEKPLIASFFAENAEERYFIAKVVNTVQRWFSAQGWPGGANPITIPASLRRYILKIPDLLCMYALTIKSLGALCRYILTMRIPGSLCKIVLTINISVHLNRYILTITISGYYDIY